MTLEVPVWELEGGGAETGEGSGLTPGGSRTSGHQTEGVSTATGTACLTSVESVSRPSEEEFTGELYGSSTLNRRRSRSLVKNLFRRPSATPTLRVGEVDILPARPS